MRIAEQRRLWLVRKKEEKCKCQYRVRAAKDRCTVLSGKNRNVIIFSGGNLLAREVRIRLS
jgi:hypothetical protein